MIASLFFFTGNALLLKGLGSANTSTWLALVLRAAIGLAIVLLFFNRNGQVDLWRAATNRLHVCRGAFGVVGTAAYYFTIQDLGAGKATLISNTYVVFAALLAIWMLREPLRWSTVAGIVISGLGLLLLLNLTSMQLIGVGRSELVAVVGAVSGAIAVIAIKQLTVTDNSATIFAAQCIFVLAFSLPFAIVHVPNTSLKTIWWMALAGFIASFGQLAMTEGFRHLSVAIGGTFQILLPMFIATGGVVFFHEVFSAWQILGASLILLGCYCAMVFRF